MTAYSTPAALPSVAGSTVCRNVSSAAIDALFSPSPASGISTRATVWFGLTFVSTGPNIRPVASARRSSSATALRTCGARTSFALTTTTAGICAPGNAFCTFS